MKVNEHWSKLNKILNFSTTETICDCKRGQTNLRMESPNTKISGTELKLPPVGVHCQVGREFAGD